MRRDRRRYSIPVFVVLIALEVLWARRHPESRGYERRDTVVSMSMGLIGMLVSAGAMFLSIAFFALLYHNRVLDLGHPAMSAYVPSGLIAAIFPRYQLPSVH